jgi:hypothetical protein
MAGHLEKNEKGRQELQNACGFLQKSMDVWVKYQGRAKSRSWCPPNTDRDFTDFSVGGGGGYMYWGTSQSVRGRFLRLRFCAGVRLFFIYGAVKYTAFPDSRSEGTYYKTGKQIRRYIWPNAVAGTKARKYAGYSDFCIFDLALSGKWSQHQPTSHTTGSIN